MANRDIVVIGGSAGALEPITQLVRELPENFPAALLVTLHIGSNNKSIIPQLLDRASALRSGHARDGEPIQKGHIYVAPPDYHLMLRPGFVHLSHGPRENGFRPAVDPLFRSAARAYGPRVIAMVLSGGLDDGVYGSQLVKKIGGVVLVQSPEEAAVASMPENTIANCDVDHIVPVAQMAPLLMQLVQQPVANYPHEEPDAEQDRDMKPSTSGDLHPSNVNAPPSSFTCPECGGSLWELHEEQLTRYRCHLGHAFSSESMADLKSAQVEEAFWAALRALEETAALCRRVAERARSRGWEKLAHDREERAREYTERAELIRRLLLEQRT